MRDACYICGNSAWTDRAGYGFAVRECGRCEELVCENCADCDADCVGDPPRFICTQWVCAGGCKSTTLVPYDPNFHRWAASHVIGLRLEAELQELGKVLR